MMSNRLTPLLFPRFAAEKEYSRPRLASTRGRFVVR